jgi:hypothetical protein
VAWYLIPSYPRVSEDEPDWPGWPHGLLAVCHWGCAIWSCVDCTSAEGRAIRFDPNDAVPGGRWKVAWQPERPSLVE